jgi:hypothetical protein
MHATPPAPLDFKALGFVVDESLQVTKSLSGAGDTSRYWIPSLDRSKWFCDYLPFKLIRFENCPGGCCSLLPVTFDLFLTSRRTLRSKHAKMFRGWLLCIAIPIFENLPPNAPDAGPADPLLASADSLERSMQSRGRCCPSLRRDFLCETKLAPSAGMIMGVAQTFEKTSRV